MNDHLIVDINMWREGRWCEREEVEAWFAEQGWTDEDVVFFGRPWDHINHVGWMFLDPTKAVMFKLVWG